ncbi:MAG TPA: hypothetical protein DCY35_04745 [Prolixibacteraceae bacterium]|nr:hypothetical protein [Prolixibacteraceae bacterium]
MEETCNNNMNNYLEPYYCNTQHCNSLHSYGPAIRDHYLFHYIHKGKGIFEIHKKQYTLTEGDGFFILPNELVYYQANEQEPWHYTWVAFHGSYADAFIKQTGFSSELPIFTLNDQNKIPFEELLNKLITIGQGEELYLKLKKVGFLYELLSYIASVGPSYKIFQDDLNIRYIKQNNTNINNHIEQAIDFISKNYSRQLTINDIAQYIHIDKHYLYEVFRKKIGSSPHNILESFRIRIACELIKTTTLSIGDISRSVGYTDQLYFSKVFKKHQGMNPTQFRAKFEL